MPPRGHSRSSHSSRSRSSSSHSRSHSSSSHSSASHSRYNSRIIARTRTNQPTDIPDRIKRSGTDYRCSKHDYTYYSESWESNGTEYKAGYYDENGKYYKPGDIIFKQDDGYYTAKLKCQYCGNNVLYRWKEGEFSSICNQCGASMSVENYTTDTILSVSDEVDREIAKDKRSSKIYSVIFSVVFIIVAIVFGGSMFSSLWEVFKISSNETALNETDSNIKIYGTELYLDLIDEQNSTYQICTSDDDYEKHLTWDYGSESYYDKESDCYIWYNTDVSPNLWQYWYEGVSNKYESGWMEYEGINNWYIEDKSGDWDIYSGDTSNFWHILCEFDNQ